MLGGPVISLDTGHFIRLIYFTLVYYYRVLIAVLVYLIIITYIGFGSNCFKSVKVNDSKLIVRWIHFTFFAVLFWSVQVRLAKLIISGLVVVWSNLSTSLFLVFYLLAVIAVPDGIRTALLAGCESHGHGWGWCWWSLSGLIYCCLYGFHYGYY